jgi:Flp pilus assembly protein TadG
MRLKEEQGAVAVIVAILLVVFMGAVAFSLDIGGLLLRRREMVNGADAAALAAAITYTDGGTTAQAQSAGTNELLSNSPGAKSHSAVPASCVYDWSEATPTKGSVSVTCVSQQQLYFATVLGFGNQHNVTSSAQATWDMSGAMTNGTQYTIDPQAKKVYVCKYVGKPGVDERLQTGNNPIEVSKNAIKGWNGSLPAWFNDAQGRSFVLATVPQDPEPTVADCPQPTSHLWLSK